MKLLEIELNNFRQHVHTSIRFAAGLTAIVGLNGVGKSSLVEALAFALYGSKALRGKLEEVKTRGANREEKCEVQLIFEPEKRVFRVVRSLSDAVLYSGGEVSALCNGSREVSVRIKSLLGMDHEEFVSAFYTEQKALEFLSSRKGAAERERFVVKMLGYDKLENVQQLLRDERRDLKAKISGVEHVLGAEEQLRARIEAESLEVDLLQGKLTESQVSLEKQSRESETFKVQFEKMQALHQQFADLKANLNREQVRFEEKAGTIKRIEDDRRDLFEKNPILREEQQQAPIDLQALRRVIDLKERALQELNKACADEEKQQTTKLAKLRAEMSLIDTQLAKLAKRQKETASLSDAGDCPTCGQTLGANFNAVLRHLAEESSLLKQEQAVKENALTELIVEPAALKRLRSELAQINSELQSERERLDLILASEKDHLALKRMEFELKLCREDLQNIDETLRALREQLKASGFDPNQHAKLKARLDTALSLEQVARLQRLKIEGTHEKAKALLERSRSSLLELQERGIELQRDKMRLLLLEESDQLLTQFRKHLNSSLRPRLAELASDFMADLSDGRYSNVEVAEDFSPTVTDLLGPRAVISGGEEDILNLSMRLALSQLLLERSGQNISLLVLDEVFGSLDENRRNNVLTLLEKLAQRYDQIIVITHFDDLKEAVQNLVYLEFDEGTGSVQVLQAELDAEQRVFNL